MKKLLATCMVVFLIAPNVAKSFYFGDVTDLEKKIVSLGDNSCTNVEESDIPTIFIPGILASWYSEEGYRESKVKRWLADPITHAYDPLFFTFKRDGYTIEDVFYKDEFNLYVEGNPKKSLYIFGYDWKKDNKITASLLSQLIGLILNEYEKHNGCNIGQVNLIGHSMGGLIARALLEDMCAPYTKSSKRGSMIIDGYTRGIKNGKLTNYKTVTCKNPFYSDTISENIKVNKLVTISTPHRGSPKSIVIWESGDIELTDNFGFGKAMKWQANGLFNMSDKEFYETVHAYNSRYPNGVVTLGQLLPDIKNINTYNDKLKYLYKNSLEQKPKKLYLENNFYPQNSFLEELNKKENIDKIFDKLTGKFISYYSTRTGDNGGNSVFEFDLSNKYKETLFGNTKTISEDNTYNIGNDLRDIYDDYESYDQRISKNYYKISGIGRDHTFYGGDGTVPTYNLKLVPNNSLEEKEISHDKFESINISCHSENYSLYKDFGKLDYEICNHSNTPTAVSFKLKNFITGNDFNYSQAFEKTSIIKNLGYTEYKSGNKGIYNDAILDNYFTDNLFKATEKENGKYLLNLGSSMDVFDRTISYDILSPINLLITDQQGRRIGIDPESGIIINEIPGAWTSGNTEGSGESEFFVIPVSGTGSIIHEIQTFGTGDGKYDIVVREYLGDKQKAKSLVITGNAKYDYGEKYRLKISELSEKSFEQISKSTKLNISRKNSRGGTNNSIDYKSNFLIFPEKDIIFEEVLLNNFDYNFNFYNNMKNYFNSKLGFALHHSFSARLSYDNQVVKVLLYNGKTNSFSRQKDFSYKKQLENNLELKENSLYFIIKDLDKSYYFSKQDLLLKKIKNAKKEFILHYDHYKRLKYVSLGEKKIFEFFYDKNTGLLSIIKDHHGNIIELIYEKIDDFYLLSKLNGKPYNFKDVVKLDIFKITFDKNIQYQEKLESIREKVLNLKVKDYRKKILASKIKNIKFDFLKRIKSDYNKNKLNYFIDNIIYFLNS